MAGLVALVAFSSRIAIILITSSNGARRDRIKLNLRAISQIESDRHFIASLDWVRKAHDHQVIAAWCKLDALPCRDNKTTWLFLHDSINNLMDLKAGSINISSKASNVDLIIRIVHQRSENRRHITVFHRRTNNSILSRDHSIAYLSAAGGSGLRAGGGCITLISRRTRRHNQRTAQYSTCNKKLLHGE
ncbi:hypothetical protein cgR_1718 [Corynebacterium glutamicum R]|uniref:Uncharacterized protein n=1 Tax=Corynebacterium glutamicum (strain R) TaxID=340322 RepID=A0AB72VBL4_CORGB|nr:hypothetical protein cgR_1718 [Corynebacterium glutamicum R]